MIQESNILIGYFHDTGIIILKNRYTGEIGKCSVEEVTRIISDVLSREIIGENSASIFRESLKNELIKAIETTIRKGVSVE